MHLQGWGQLEKVSHNEINTLFNTVYLCIFKSQCNFSRVNINCNDMMTPMYEIMGDKDIL